MTEPYRILDLGTFQSQLHSRVPVRALFAGNVRSRLSQGSLYGCQRNQFCMEVTVSKYLII